MSSSLAILFLSITTPPFYLQDPPPPLFHFSPFPSSPFPRSPSPLWRLSSVSPFFSSPFFLFFRSPPFFERLRGIFQVTLSPSLSGFPGFSTDPAKFKTSLVSLFLDLSEFPSVFLLWARAFPDSPRGSRLSRSRSVLPRVFAFMWRSFFVFLRH